MSQPQQTLDAHEFHLFYEDAEGSCEDASASPSAGDETGAARKLEVSDGISYLVLSRAGRPRLETRRPRSMANVILLEPVEHRHGRALAMVAPPEDRPTVNTQPAPRVALLHEGDQILLSDHVLHVAVYNRPQIHPPGPEHVGRTCPYCRTSIQAETLVYVCPCGTAMHCEDKSCGEEPMECARMTTTCLECKRPVVMTSGYGYLPDFARDESHDH